MLSLDLLGFGLGYEVLTAGFKWRTRALSPEEIALLRTIYADSVKYHLIRIDERARLGTRKGGICYVSGHTINSWGHIPPELLVHEVIHIWQYERIGLAYIPRALRAQRSAAGYNYGGVEQLRHLRKQGATLWDLNLEQQGDLVADYYCLREGLVPSWVPRDVSAHEEFPYWIGQLAESDEVVA
ncbi:MAG: hypothetical protein H6555_04015 [Lewinellaceae bacterium]|nr:hypothetical protein [Lewinellaceae bacterium]